MSELFDFGSDIPIHEVQVEKILEKYIFHACRDLDLPGFIGL